MIAAIGLLATAMELHVKHFSGRRKFITLLGIIAAFLSSTACGQEGSREQALINRVLRMQANFGALLTRQFVSGIQSQMGWTVQLPWSAGTIDQRRFDALRLLRQVPAITEVYQLDAEGIGQLLVSRLTMNPSTSKPDFSQDPKFKVAIEKKVYYGPTYFREAGPEHRPIEPYWTLSVAGARRDGGVSVAEINLKMLWDLMTQTKMGEHGTAYLIDTQGRLLAHSDITLVIRNTDMTGLAQVKAARTSPAPSAAQVLRTKDISGREVLATYAAVPDLDWLLFVELPTEEANRLAQ